ncbi:hypothetical protein [Candidatus Uabimicrobium sp. HlEnr_7]|uniref:hypothetical protein n=1 Tax=Candidatus Uabimicrobium helgolandensis TaxID=3095367 RepID=UPI003556E633
MTNILVVHLILVGLSLVNAGYLQMKIKHFYKDKEKSLWKTAIKSSCAFIPIYSILFAIVGIMLAISIPDESAGDAVIPAMLIFLVLGAVIIVLLLSSIFVFIAKKHYTALQTPVLHSINFAILAVYLSRFCLYVCVF